MPFPIPKTLPLRDGYRRTFAVAVGLLGIWGLAFGLFNALFFKFAYFFVLKPVGVALAFASFHLAYVLIAFPAVLFHRQFGYKLGMLIGLCVFGTAGLLLFAAITLHATIYFLCAVMVIGACVAWLDTSLNPLAVVAGKPESAVKRLNFAHAFYGVGIFAGYYIVVFILGPNYLTSKVTAQDAVLPYVLVGLGAIFLAFAIEHISLPKFASKGSGNGSHWRDEMRVLLHDKPFRFAALAMAAYSVVLTILWTTNYRYNEHEMAAHLITVVERGSLWFALGRIVGVFLMQWLSPMMVMRVSSALCLLTIAVAAAAGGTMGWISLTSCSFLLSITYPTIFGTTLCENGRRMALAAGLLVIAAGIGNTLAALCTSLALDALLIHPRAVVIVALPFQAIVVAYALKSAAGRTTAATA